MKLKKGFTLLELLIVIGIMTILTTAVVLILDPVELAARARDAKRMNDLDKLKNAVNLYLATATSTDLTEGVSGDYASVSVSGAVCPFTGTVTCPPYIGGFICCSLNVERKINGEGWIKVNFGKISGGSPFAVLPIDPTNNTTYYYSYTADEDQQLFEINARLESKKYRDKMKEDGGNRNNCLTYTEFACYYEVGNDPGLDLLLNGIIF